MKKIIRFLLGVTACGVLLYAGAHLAEYVRESGESKALRENLIEEAVSPCSDPTEKAPITVDFSALEKENADIIAWLYCEDTPIHLPIVQGRDNSYYLQHLFDGTRNSSGTLFADDRNSGDFSDSNTIIYGHSMKNKEMFGSLSAYREQAYFDEHRTMWLLTPQGVYRVELVAGYVTQTTSDVYTFPQSAEEVYALVLSAAEQSTFDADIAFTKTDRFLTLSTCSYEYDNARYVLIGRLTALS